MNMIVQLGIIFIFLGLGELFIWITGIPIPSSIIGMLFLFFALCFKIVKLSAVEKSADLLVKNMGFFFVPAGIGVMKYFNLISNQWLPIVLSVVISTFLIILFSGGAYEIMQAKDSKFKRKKLAD